METAYPPGVYQDGDTGFTTIISPLGTWSAHDVWVPTFETKTALQDELISRRQDAARLDHHSRSPDLQQHSKIKNKFKESVPTPIANPSASSQDCNPSPSARGEPARANSNSSMRPPPITPTKRKAEMVNGPVVKKKTPVKKNADTVNTSTTSAKKKKVVNECLASLSGSNLREEAKANSARAPLDKTVATTSTKQINAWTKSDKSESREEREQRKKDRKRVLQAARVFGFSQKRIKLVQGETGKWMPTAVHDSTGKITSLGMNTSIYNHQLLGAAWMLIRETGTLPPFGGLLASAMGFGKSITTIAAMLRNTSADGLPTLIVVRSGPLVDQWCDELNKHVKAEKGLEIAQFDMSKSSRANFTRKNLEARDFIVTTYAQVLMSHTRGQNLEKAQNELSEQDQLGLLHQINFHRVVLDECQDIKNDKAKTSLACRKLKAKHRWGLSGTPISNTISELYPILNFIGDPSAQGTEADFERAYCQDNDASRSRLLEVISRSVHRLTHDDTLFGRTLLDLPPMEVKVVPVHFNKIERIMYDLFAGRLRELAKAHPGRNGRQSKYGLMLSTRLRQLTAHPFIVEEQLKLYLTDADNKELWNLAGNPDNERNPILVLPNHPRGISLSEQARDSGSNIKSRDQKSSTQRKEPGSRYFLRKYLNDPQSADGKPPPECASCKLEAENPHRTGCGHVLCHECMLELLGGAGQNAHKAKCPACHLKLEGSVNDSEPDIKSESEADTKPGLSWSLVQGKILSSPKIRATVGQIKEWKSKFPGIKVVVFTQWIPMIKLVGNACADEGWKYKTFHGEMSTTARKKALHAFKTESETSILIMSIKCGSTGLNITEASGAISLDPWWNATMEQQAFKRLHRIGQTREVHGVRFVVSGTIDEHIVAMQRRKDEAIKNAMEVDHTEPELGVKEWLELFLGGSDEDITNHKLFGDPDLDMEFHDSDFVDDESSHDDAGLDDVDAHSDDLADPAHDMDSDDGVNSDDNIDFDQHS